eukprot:m.9558 g.9558  ORF g.9558 m.9558 type:complete len:171 (-) comp6951_c0_seq1:364-876(-)
MASMNIARAVGRYQHAVNICTNRVYLTKSMVMPCNRDLQSSGSVTSGSAKVKVPVAPGRWGELAKCSRAVRAGNTVFVAGTCCPGDSAADQVRAIFDVIEPALEQCGASLKDVVSTRMIAADIRSDWEALGEAHGKVFGETRPACTLVGGELLMDWMKVEIEVTAVVDTA